MKTSSNNNNIESNNGMSQVIIDMRPQVKHHEGYGREKVADVYFRTQVRAYSRQVYGDYSQEAHEAAEKALTAFYSEVVELLKGEGWTLLNDYAKWHTCPELAKGDQYLYVHPDSISGEVNPADIDALEAKFKALTACEYRGTDNCGDIILTRSEADERMLYRETYAEGIAATIKECTTTKRSNLYKDRGDALGCIRNRIAIQNKRTDLTGHGTGYYRERKAVAGFVQEEYDRLLQAGYIKEATGQNGRTLCRWINKKEEKERAKARREAEKAEKERNKAEQHKALCDELCTLLGYKAWEIKKDACTGKFAGSYDYSLKFEDGKELYICTRKDLFETNVTELIDGFKRTSKEGYKHGDMVKTKNSGRVAKVMRVGTVCEGYGTMLYLKEEGVAPKDNRFVEIHNLICSADEVEPLQPASEVKDEPTLYEMHSITADERKAHTAHYAKVIRNRAQLARTAWTQYAGARIEVSIAYRNGTDDPDGMSFKVCYYQDEQLKDYNNGVTLEQAARMMADFHLLSGAGVPLDVILYGEAA